MPAGQQGRGEQSEGERVSGSLDVGPCHTRLPDNMLAGQAHFVNPVYVCGYAARWQVRQACLDGGGR